MYQFMSLFCVKLAKDKEKETAAICINYLIKCFYLTHNVPYSFAILFTASNH